MEVSLTAFLCKLAKRMLLRIVNNNRWGDSISLKNYRQSFMSMILQPQWMHARPNIMGTVILGILILASGHNTSLHCVRKKRVGKKLISHHLVICWEMTCQGRMQTCSDTPLSGLLYSIQILSLVNILPSGQGLRIDVLDFCGLDIAKAGCRVKVVQVVSIQYFDM